MMNLMFPEQLQLRAIVFGAIDDWNNRHPRPVGSPRERASVSVSHVYADGDGEPTFAVTVVCSLAGNAPLIFRGADLVTLVEDVRRTLERKIAEEIRRRTKRLHRREHDGEYGIAV